LEVHGNIGAVLTVRELRHDDLPALVSYWTKSPEAHLIGMGVELAKLPSYDELFAAIALQLAFPLKEKQSYALAWLIDGVPAGHCNVNQIVFGARANLHLHLWHPSARQSGYGRRLLLKSLPYFFENLGLESLYCEPFAENPAPNKTLASIGFRFVKTYETIPGSINHLQSVNQWALSRDQYLSLCSRA